MKIGKLDHVNLRTTQLRKMIAWYEDILGMENGHRPEFPFPGAWMYGGEGAAVHLVGIEGPAATGSEVPLKLEHFSFRATGEAAFKARLDETGEAYKRNELPQINLVLYNVWDPDGNHIHIDFPMEG